MDDKLTSTCFSLEKQALNFLSMLQQTNLDLSLSTAKLDLCCSKYKQTGILYTPSSTVFLFPTPIILQQNLLFFDRGERKGLKLPYYEEGFEEADWCNIFPFHPFLREHSRRKPCTDIQVTYQEYN